MRVLFLLRDLSPNGITTYNRTLARELVRQGHEVTVWPPLDGGHGGFPGALLHPWCEPLLRASVVRLRPEVLFVSHYTQARLAQRLSQTLGIPWFACMHNGHSGRRMAQWAELFRSASGIVTMCDTMHRLYVGEVSQGRDFPGGHVPPVLASRLPLALPPLNARGTGKGPLTLAYCSRLSGHKGPRCEAWLRAIALIPGHQALRAMVIGGGSHLVRLRQVARELGLDVEFTGMVADTGPCLQRVDVLAGAGYALMEGLVRGCSGVGLGFGGCWGAVTPSNLSEAVAVNFGDHCPYPLPEDPPSLAQALQDAMALVGTDGATQVTSASRELFAPQDIAKGVARFWSQAVVPPAKSPLA